jgi:hypothetical protein
LRPGWTFWSDGIPCDQVLILRAWHTLADDLERSLLRNAGENLDRSLRSSLTADEEQAQAGKRAGDDASIEHIFTSQCIRLMPEAAY